MNVWRTARMLWEDRKAMACLLCICENQDPKYARLHFVAEVLTWYVG